MTIHHFTIMKIVIKSLRFIYVWYAVLLFVALMLVIMPVAVVAFFMGRIRGGNLIYWLCSLWADVWFLLIGIRHTNLYIGTKYSDHASIYVANHTSYMDIPVLVKAIRRPMRILAKVELSKIPVFGFLYRQATVMVDRSSLENRSKSVIILKGLLKKGVSVFIFPEGTFNTTGQPLKDFYNGAFRIAIETQTPVKPVVFLDSVDRLHHESLFLMSPGISRAVFLEEVPVTGLSAGDINRLKDRVHALMEAELRKWKTYEAQSVVH